MRIKDEQKQDAIIKATIELVNEIGFVSSSVSKIAKRANVSPATIYIYYKNKEELLVSTYVDIKIRFGSYITESIDFSQPIRDIIFNVWSKTFGFISNNKEFFNYTEQFTNSPYHDLVNHKQLEIAFEPIINIINEGIKLKIIKDVNFDIIMAFMFFPIFILSNPKHCKTLKISDDIIETSFNLAWDAIKL